MSDYTDEQASNFVRAMDSEKQLKERLKRARGTAVRPPSCEEMSKKKNREGSKRLTEIKTRQAAEAQGLKRPDLKQKDLFGKDAAGGE